ncbi:hypothetical protein MNV49_004557 [Pseudohyphozyma bogoriensis]|nr:hypothetical protein MNV49_004557 [Pseudohyphozyma bogoriensis]
MIASTLLSALFLTSLVTASPVPSTVAKRAQSAKKGICYTDILEADALGGAISWAYNWDSAEGSGLPSGVVYFPQLWGLTSDHTTQWNANANAAIAGGSTALLGFNEPDNSGQSDLSVADAVTGWNTYIQPFAGQATLVSPAITNGGQAWMYDAATNTAYFQSYLEGLYAAVNKPIWITEFMGTGTTAEQQTFLETVIPWMDAQDWIVHYAPFGVSGEFANILVGTDGVATALGTTYYDTV